MFSTIVVGIDGSGPARHALQIACDLAQKYDSVLHLVHVPEKTQEMIAMTAGSFPAEATHAEAVAAGKAVMDEAVTLARNANVIPASTHIGEDNPAAELLKAIADHGADLVVTGRRGLGGIGAMLLGSTSTKIAQGATCACLTVK